jgi:hypothetical protein
MQRTLLANRKRIEESRTNRASRRGMRLPRRPVGQQDDLEAFLDIVLGYIKRMLMAEDIDDKLEHSLEHPMLRC